MNKCKQRNYKLPKDYFVKFDAIPTCCFKSSYTANPEISILAIDPVFYHK